MASIVPLECQEDVTVVAVTPLKDTAVVVTSGSGGKGPGGWLGVTLWFQRQ